MFLSSLIPVAIRDSRLDVVSTICRVTTRLRPEVGHLLRNAIVGGQLDVVRALLCRGPNEEPFVARLPLRFYTPRLGFRFPYPSCCHPNMLLKMEIRTGPRDTQLLRDRQRDEWPLILIAAHSGRSEIVTELLNAKADPSRTGKIKMSGQPLTALYVAVKGGFRETVWALLGAVHDAAQESDSEKKSAREKLQLEFYNEQDRATPLLMAARKGGADVLRDLVGAGVSLSARRLSCNEFAPSDSGKKSYLLQYLSRGPLSLTPLGTCVYRRWPEESIRALLDMKADPGRAVAARSSSAEDAGLSPSSRGNREDKEQPAPVEESAGDEIPLALLAATALIPLAPDAPVVICGLESEAGKQLNGLRGRTIRYDGGKDRWGVHIPGPPWLGSRSAVKAVKSENLRAVGDGTIYPRATGAQGTQRYSSDDPLMPQNCLYDPLTAQESALARTELLLQRGARPFSAPNSRYSFPEFFEELATFSFHRCHGPQYWAELVKLFLQYEVNPERTGQALLFALTAAVARERQRRADVLAAGEEDLWLDLSDALSSMIARVELLVIDLSVDAAAVLRHAAASGRADVIRELVWFAPDVIVHKPDPEHHRTALHCAAAAGHNDVAQLLLNDEAVAKSVEIPGKDGHTALDLAAANGHAEVVATLLRAGGGQKWGRCLGGDKSGAGRRSDDISLDGERPALRKALEEAVSGQHVSVVWQLLLSAVEETEKKVRAEVEARPQKKLNNSLLEKIESSLVREHGGGATASSPPEGEEVRLPTSSVAPTEQGGAAQDCVNAADTSGGDSGRSQSASQEDIRARISSWEALWDHPTE